MKRQPFSIYCEKFALKRLPEYSPGTSQALQANSVIAGHISVAIIGADFDECAHRCKHHIRICGNSLEMGRESNPGFRNLLLRSCLAWPRSAFLVHCPFASVPFAPTVLQSFRH